MAKVLEIEELGNPILRKKAKRVKDIGDEYVQNLIDNLAVTVLSVNGVGIAAPQVNEPFQIFMIYSHPNPRYPDAPTTEPKAIINPKITSMSGEMVKDWEGCLSIPGIRGLVPRHRWISVEYSDRDGNKKTEELEDFVARIFQHEYDHLNGIVFLDRIDSVDDIITDKEYIKLIS